MRRGADAACDAGWAPFWRYLGLGRYGEQLQNLYELFPREQVHVLRYKELVDAPHETLNRICEFLGVDAGRRGRRSRRRTCRPTSSRPSQTRMLQALLRAGAAVGSLFPPQVWRKASIPLLKALKRQQRNRPELERRRTASSWCGCFADDIALLEELTGESFEDWLGQPDRRDVLRAQVVGAVGPGGLVVQAVPAVGQRHDADVPQAATVMR